MASGSDAAVTLSVVLPVYNVQEFLPQCLESLFQQAAAGVEVVAVDDASPDDCGVILDDYARRDPRLRVVHLDRNRGLGEARNIGLDHAHGDYVWFVDSDDWVTSGAVAAVRGRLERSRPDVLVFDHARELAPGRLAPNPWSRLLREPPPEEVFTLDERPSVLGLMMTAWNKAIRREYLLDLGLRFGGGFYEDVAVTYPILMAAERISLLDRVCYVYRVRRTGAITATASERHFEVFDGYGKIFAFMDARKGRADDHRAAMFDRMIWHYTTIAEDPARVPAASRRPFFRRVSQEFREHRPSPYRYPPGARGIKFRLVERDLYWLFRGLRPFNRTRLVLRAAARRAGGAARTGVRRAKAVAPLAYYQLQKRLPMDDRLAVYAAYWYRGYSCNPKAIYEKARELAPDVHGVWVAGPEAAASLPPGTDHVVPGSLRYFRVMGRAKYLVNNVNFPHAMSKRRGSVHVQTLHGTPLKRMGLEQAAYPAGARNMNFARLRKHSRRWDFVVSANPLSSQVWRRAYPGDYEILETGYPRNDRLFHATADDIARIRRDLGIDAGKTAVLYAPTYRDHLDELVYPLDPSVLAAALGPRYALLVRAHYLTGSAPPPAPAAGSAPVVDVSAHPAVEDLCLAADILITDYSSIMFDYAHLDRPIVVYAPDWETYGRTRGVTFDLLAEPPGPVARTEDELIACFKGDEPGSASSTARRAAFRRRFCVFDNGRAAERVVRRVYLGEKGEEEPRQRRQAISPTLSGSRRDG
ncbi:bifunctional glycosyltransferase/CDP-glycerol:glycerophosphate glycerophosphotransferase [Actinomadura verrucosospora]|uniref:CDP-glycerol:poly(Glycerophosphate) glycerophosphotransferase n=1 Tax=Actinomadura verrucosospora TaxID=46165 RepID=A0A7D3VPV1_ACTVE|nr:bifunctional glycosyltransferase family 2 protein/CDP-glycerol:glycerophosphate glycerophosphotransferase [Actinomadura verrucosospora]QKG19820.1 CDP-glycerol:poly(glycerophosphate) glycerophosphotransferase [Actinomadura verrucosospora]